MSSRARIRAADLAEGQCSNRGGGLVNSGACGGGGEGGVLLNRARKSIKGLVDRQIFGPVSGKAKT